MGQQVMAILAADAGIQPLGVMWPHDQFTYRRIEDGAIEEISLPERVKQSGRKPRSPRIEAMKL